MSSCIMKMFKVALASAILFSVTSDKSGSHQCEALLLSKKSCLAFNNEATNRIVQLVAPQNPKATSNGKAATRPIAILNRHLVPLKGNAATTYERPAKMNGNAATIYDPIASMADEEFASRVMRYSTEGTFASDVKDQVSLFGYVRVINDSSRSTSPFPSPSIFTSEFLKNMGFVENFGGGQRASEDIHAKWFDKDRRLRYLDNYSKDFYLLPNNEVAYQNETPSHVLMYCNKAPKTGGRTFIHSVEDIEAQLQNSAPELLDKYEKFGTRLSFGYFSKADPSQEKVYTKHIEEAFGEDALDAAVENAEAFAGKHDLDSVEVKTHVVSGVEYRYLMTHTTLPGFVYSSDGTRRYFRPPRIAATPPAVENGYREFTFGDGSKYAREEIQHFIHAFLETRSGMHWKQGDFVVFDNITHCHSKEAHDGSMELLVSMANSIDVRKNYDIIYPRVDENAVDTPKAMELEAAGRYWGFSELQNANEMMWKRHVSMMAFDLQDRVLDAELGNKIKMEFKRYGALHIINNGNRKRLVGGTDESLTHLGFTPGSLYGYGGKGSGRTPRTLITSKTTGVDKYPKELFLLPHNEILYQRALPKHMVFIANNPAEKGGRTFTHNAKVFQDVLTRENPDLVEKLLRAEQDIETSFLSEEDPDTMESGYFLVPWESKFVDAKDKNNLGGCTNSNQQQVADIIAQFSETQYFGNIDSEEQTRRAKMMLCALRCCIMSVDKFDSCDWRVSNNGYPMLTTRISIPLSKKVDGSTYMFFPRIQYDEPEAKNGFRKFTVNGAMLDLKERQSLLNAFWLSREALFHKKDDLHLVDNVRCGHSRESYSDESRSTGVAMAGVFWSDDLGRVLNKRNYLVNESNFVDALQASYPKQDAFGMATVQLKLKVNTATKRIANLSRQLVLQNAKRQTARLVPQNARQPVPHSHVNAAKLNRHRRRIAKLNGHLDKPSVTSFNIHRHLFQYTPTEPNHLFQYTPKL